MRKVLVVFAVLSLFLAVPVTAGAESNACPPNSQNPGGTPPSCGNQDPGPPAPEPAPECGPQTEGGTSPPGPVTGPVWSIGGAVTDGGGAPLGDFVQAVACALNDLTGL